MQYSNEVSSKVENGSGDVGICLDSYKKLMYSIFANSLLRLLFEMIWMALPILVRCAHLVWQSMVLRNVCSFNDDPYRINDPIPDM